MNREAHYEVRRTRAGRSVAFVNGRGGTVMHGVNLTSDGAAMNVILSVAAAHSPVRQATIDPNENAVHVYAVFQPYFPPRAGQTPEYVTIPIRWLDDQQRPAPRVAGVLERAFARVGRGIVGVPPGITQRAAASRGLWLERDEPIRNGDSHDA